MTVSIIIPVKNGAQTLGKCLAEIRNQTIASQVEIIVLDSMSTDGSQQIAAGFGARIIDIPNGTFNHGLTRNRGVKIATADLLYFTVQDAYLAERDQLEKMESYFSDSQVQAMVGMQAIPHDKDKNPARWFKRFSIPKVVYKHFPNGAFENMSLQEKFDFSAWDNVNAMYRKSALEQLPFPETNFSEDWLWANKALSASMKIGFDPSLVVYHYHHLSFGYIFRLQYIINYNFFKVFKVFPTLPRVIKPFLSAVKTISGRKELNSKEKVYWIGHNLSSLLGFFLSHFVFILIGKLFSEKLLDISYRIFVKSVPQGKVK